jgi:TraX protein
MTTFQIKLIAIATMIIDHIAFFFYPLSFWPRLIGRLSFPLFAWLIANGAHHTKNINKYLLRLLIFAIFTQPIFNLANHAFHPNLNYLNVLFTLSLGIIAIILIKKFKGLINQIIITLLLTYIAITFKMDFNTVGVASIVCFYLFYQNPKAMLISQSLIYTLPALFHWYKFPPQSLIYATHSIRYYAPFALLSLLIINKYNDKLGPRLKYLFYLIYPFQYIIFYLIKTNL